MSLMEYTDFFANACFLHEPDPTASWEALHREQQRVVDFLSGCRQLRITAPGTELEFRCDGRIWINGAGKQNLPDGEVYTAPIEDSMQGYINFSYPSIFNGTITEGVQLKLVDGMVVEATAQRGQEFLNSMLALDAGARYVGEAAFGMNYGIQRATGHAIFDEKIGGTMHLALGSACPGTGGSNQSMLHWDLVCDLRESEVYADGELCYRNGRFLL
jgi:aminopeptidase